MKLSDLNCTMFRPEPGCKILVRYRIPLDAQQKKEIQKKVERWAGSGVDVLLLDENCFSLEILSGNQLQGNLG